uniref:LigA n=1 Tax=Parastrongyloides trichosuri TaxID=131310 RepID=A0A0N4Z401_PARTI
MDADGHAEGRRAHARAGPRSRRRLHRRRGAHAPGAEQPGQQRGEVHRKRAGPLHHGRHGTEDGVDIAAGLKAEHGAAIVEQVELDVAAATDQLFLALRVGPGLVHPAGDDLRIDLEEGLADRLGEGEVLLPVAAVVVVVEDAAGAARLVAVGQEEILVAPVLVFGVPRRVEGVAGALHGGVEVDGVGVVVATVRVQHGRQVAAAAEPGLGRRDQPGVHVHGGHARADGVADQADAGGVEARVFLCPRHLLGVVGGEGSVDGRAVDADLFEQAAAHHAHDAAAAFLAVPGGADEAAGFAGEQFGGGGVFQRLETGVDLVAQGLEPDAGALAALNHQGGVSLDHEGFNHDAAFLNSPAGRYTNGSLCGPAVPACRTRKKQRRGRPGLPSISKRGNHDPHRPERQTARQSAGRRLHRRPGGTGSGSNPAARGAGDADSEAHAPDRRAQRPAVGL